MHSPLFCGCTAADLQQKEGFCLTTDILSAGANVDSLSGTGTNEENIYICHACIAKIKPDSSSRCSKRTRRANVRHGEMMSVAIPAGLSNRANASGNGTASIAQEQEQDNQSVRSSESEGSLFNPGKSGTGKRKEVPDYSSSESEEYDSEVEEVVTTKSTKTKTKTKTKPSHAKKQKNAAETKKNKKRPETPQVTSLATFLVKSNNNDTNKQAAPVNSSTTSIANSSTNPTNNQVDLTQDNEDNSQIEYLNAGENAYRSYTLHSPAANRTSAWWKFYLTYDQVKHPEMKAQAKCRVVGCSVSVTTVNGSNGLKTHIKHKHSQLYHKMVFGETKSDTIKPETSTSSSAMPESKGQSMMSAHFNKRPTPKQMRMMFKERVAVWTMMTCMPFTACEDKYFRAMFEPLSADAPDVVKSANHVSIRDTVDMYGVLAKRATELEIMKYKWAATTDHWTPPGNDVTYTCNTLHAITDKWTKINILQDFQVFEGSTSGENIFKYQNARWKLNSDNPSVFYVTVDTTGNMGTFTQLCRNHGTEAGYCTEHVFHLNALIAFEGKCKFLYSCQYRHISNTFTNGYIPQTRMYLEPME